MWGVWEKVHSSRDLGSSQKSCSWGFALQNVTSVTKDFSGKAIWKFICRLILERSRMCALPAQRDLRQSGTRRTMKRHTTRFKILSTNNYCKICECEMCGKELKAPIIWKFAKMKNDTIALFAHWDFILIPEWDIMEQSNTSLSQYFQLKSLRSL